MLEQGAVSTIILLSNTDDMETQMRCAASLRCLAQLPSGRLNMVQLGAATALIAIARASDKDEMLRACAEGLCAFSKSKSARTLIATQGAVPVLIKLSESPNLGTKKSCSIALANLSTASSAVGMGTTMAMIAITNDSEQADGNPTEAQKAQLAGSEEPPSNMKLRDIAIPETINFPAAVTIHIVTPDKVGAGMGGSVPAPPTSTAHEPEAPDAEVVTEDEQHSHVVEFAKMEQSTEPTRRNRYNSLDSMQGVLDSLANSPRFSPRDDVSGPLSAVTIAADEKLETGGPTLEVVEPESKCKQ
jgi:hypothetical protein